MSTVASDAPGRKAKVSLTRGRIRRDCLSQTDNSRLRFIVREVEEPGVTESIWIERNYRYWELRV